MSDPRTTTSDDVVEAKDFALEAFLPYRLSLLSNTISEGIAIAYRDVHGLSLTEWRVLAILGRFPDLTATDVRAQGAMDKVAVSRAVSRLDDKGLIRRTAQPEDRRRVALRLTRKGVKLFNAVVPEALAYEQRLLASLSDEEQRQLDAMMARLLEAARDLGTQTHD